MSDLTDQKSTRSSACLRAFCVHLLTASGTGLALIAMLEAVREHWAAMFGWLGLALLIDAIDGPLARRLDVGERLPNWSGETLDLVVDFVTYVFVPAYVITASGLLLPLAAPLLGFVIVVSGALYFADRRMKTDDNRFRGFPALWNLAAFYLFLLKPPASIGSAALALLVVLSFVPVHVMHPVRTMRFRPFNLTLMVLWAALCIFTVAANFDVSAIVKIVLCAIALYVLFSDLILRTFTRRFS
ncbi:MAG: phosphatidylcholine synthase [Afipia sp. 64-13]|nr:MAG: phosphatidylcholine synthase [Afipia sp. 64-13]